jgi:hypothetical protein
LLKRYVLPVAPERHGGFVNNLLWGFKSDFCKFLNSIALECWLVHTVLYRELF